MKHSNDYLNKAPAAGTILTGIMFFAAWVVVFLARWVFTTWSGLRMDELIFQLKAPLEGTGDGIIMKGVMSSILPAAAATALYFLVYFWALNKDRRDDTTGANGPAVKAPRRRSCRNQVLFCGLILSFLLIAGASVFAFRRLELGSYIKNQMNDSSFIEDHYVDPADVTIRFPQKKRNLIYIFLESLEVTYVDQGSGGAFTYNNMPELTALSAKGEDFSGETGLLNGGKVLPGTTFTMGGIFAQTAALPLKIDIGEEFTDKRGSFNNMNTQDAFFEKVTNLGDILANEGYKNVFMLGSNAAFGGRRLYFGTHGDYEIDDYNWAIEKGIIPKDYYVFWGMEDSKLFAAAKDRITELAASDQPFNFTLLTVDTHFEDGYICELCKEQYPGNNYANAIACSSRQVSAFVDWIRKQDFYENTTIVLCGDHTTMDRDFCQNVPESYDRKVYTTFLNAAATPEDPTRVREYSTMDQFPTTLAALGCTIDGDRLGLGTNLYSSKDTLIEQYGYDEVSAEMEKKSNFMIELADINIYSEKLLEARGLLPKAVLTMDGFDTGRNLMTFTLRKIENIQEEFKRIELRINDGKKTEKVLMKQEEEGVYRAEADVSKVNYKNASLTAVVIGKSGREFRSATMTGDLSLKRNEICEYLDALLENPRYTVFITVRDDGSHSLNTEICERLEKLGCGVDLRGHYRWSYFAVISPDGVIEDYGETELSHSGKLSDGAEYSVISQGGLSGAGGGAGRYLTCSVKIDGIEYAVKRIGHNFVVYDTENHCVVDSVEFNTYMGLDPKRTDVAVLIESAKTAEEQMNIQTN